MKQKKVQIMRKIILLFLLISTPMQSQDDFSTYRKEEKDKKDKDKTTNSNIEKYLKSNKILNLTEPIIISSDNSSFDDISNFTFQENIIYNPSVSYTYPTEYTDYPAAIIINKDNVTIDFSGFSLLFDPTSASNNKIHGIAVMPGVKNLKIISNTSTEKKGCITGFLGFAIYMLGRSANNNNLNSYTNSIMSPSIHNLHVIQNNSGIYIGNSIQPSISYCDIHYNYSSAITYGIHLSQTIDGIVNNCNVNMNSSITDVYGIQLEDVSNTSIQNSTFNFNRSLTSGGTIGISITGTSTETSSDNRIINCTANGNICAQDNSKESIGICIDSPSSYNTIQNCITLRQNCNKLTTGSNDSTTFSNSYGIKINNSEFNQLIENKSGYNNYGFHDSLIPSTSFYFENLSVKNRSKNYEVFISNSLNDGYSIPLPTKTIYQDIASTNNYSSTFSNNVEIK